jgi:hypothetical protein
MAATSVVASSAAMEAAATETATGMHAPAAAEAASSTATTATAASATTGIGIVGDEASREQNDHRKASENRPKHVHPSLLDLFEQARLWR